MKFILTNSPEEYRKPNGRGLYQIWNMLISAKDIKEAINLASAHYWRDFVETDVKIFGPAATVSIWKLYQGGGTYIGFFTRDYMTENYVGVCARTVAGTNGYEIIEGSET